jgi:hypothetical protein
VATADPGTDPGVLRERLVRARDDTVETTLVATIVLIVVAALALRAAPMLLERTGGDGLAFYQTAELSLTGDPALLYRTLSAAVPDVTALREQTGRWPQPAALAAAGVPPFAAATLPAALRATIWVGYDSGSWIDYYGQSLAPGGGAFVLRVIDPQAQYHPHPRPDQAYDPALKTAAQTWWFAERPAKYPGERLMDAGGKWIVRAPQP